MIRCNKRLKLNFLNNLQGETKRSVEPFYNHSASVAILQYRIIRISSISSRSQRHFSKIDIQCVDQHLILSNKCIGNYSLNTTEKDTKHLRPTTINGSRINKDAVCFWSVIAQAPWFHVTSQIAWEWPLSFDIQCSLIHSDLEYNRYDWLDYHFNFMS